MIFASHRQVVAGKKTSTRFPMRPYPQRIPERRPPGVRHHAPPPRPPAKVRAFDREWRALGFAAPVTPQRPGHRGRPGDILPIHAKQGEPAVAHVQVTSVHFELAGDITPTAAASEGFASVERFKAAWVRLYDRTWARHIDQLVPRLPLEDRRITDELLPDITRRVLLRRLRELTTMQIVRPLCDGTWDATRGAEREALVTRFDQRHATRPIWVVEFELIADRAVLLAQRPPAPRAHDKDFDPTCVQLEDVGYTLSESNALADEPEAVAEAWPRTVKRVADITSQPLPDRRPWAA